MSTEKKSKRMDGREYVGVWMDKSFIQAIDKDRGHLDQSTYIRQLIFEKLGQEHKLDQNFVYPKDRARINREMRRRNKLS